MWWAAHRLNRHVMDALLQAGLPAVCFPPSSSAVCRAGELVELAIEPMERALDAGLLPLVQGDVAFDRSWGATIVSTEQVMGYLARQLRPGRVLLAGVEAGVYAQFPARGPVLELLRRRDLPGLSMPGASGPDVTGGMDEKVSWALDLAAALPGAEVRIFSGAASGDVLAALKGGSPGTLVSAAD